MASEQKEVTLLVFCVREEECLTVEEGLVSDGWVKRDVAYYAKGDKTVGVYMCSTMTNPDMHMHVSDGLKRFTPSLAVLIGYAGSLCEEHTVGTVVFAKDVIRCDTTRDDGSGRVDPEKCPMISVNSTLSYLYTALHERFTSVHAAAESDRATFEFPPGTETVAECKLMQGRVAARDSVLANAATKAAIRTTLGAHVVAMEDFGYLRALEANNVPGIILRVVSDMSDASKANFERDYSCSREGYYRSSIRAWALRSAARSLWIVADAFRRPATSELALERGAINVQRDSEHMHQSVGSVAHRGSGSVNVAVGSKHGSQRVGSVG